MHIFTPRQQQIVECMLRGLVTKEIAAELHLSPGSVRVVIARFIYPKTGAHSRAEFFWWYYNVLNGIIGLA
jgi:DNA-binding NarL/FixJ family response regulator